MRRIPPALWILTPLLLGLLGAAAWHVLAPAPTVTNVVPGDAILTMRFKDLAALDRTWYRSSAIEALPRDFVFDSLNLKGLPGIDPHRPFHLVYVPREHRPDPSMLIVPVADEGRLRDTFDDPTAYLEQGAIRHAKHLEISGDWAAVGGDRGALRHLGEGGLTARALGEDHVVAIDVPALAEFALTAPTERPWREILAALGFDPSTAAPDKAGTGIEATRVVRVASAWRTARLWSFFAERRVRLEAEPTRGTALAAALQAFYDGPEDRTELPLPPRQAQAWIAVPDARARAALAWVLWSAGIAFPDGLGEEGHPLGAWGRAEGGAGLLMFAVPSIGYGHAWTLGIVAPDGTLPPLAPFHASFPAEPGEADVAAGELRLTQADLRRGTAPPKGQIVFTRQGGLDRVTVGAAAKQAQAILDITPIGNAEGPPTEAGWRALATFRLVGVRARSILGEELTRGGILAALGSGTIQGVLSTDGRTLRLDATTAESP